MMTVVEFSKVLLTQNKSCCVLSSSHACGDLFARGTNCMVESAIHMSQVVSIFPNAVLSFRMLVVDYFCVEEENNFWYSWSVWGCKSPLHAYFKCSELTPGSISLTEWQFDISNFLSAVPKFSDRGGVNALSVQIMHILHAKVSFKFLQVPVCHLLALVCTTLFYIHRPELL